MNLLKTTLVTVLLVLLVMPAPLIAVQQEDETEFVTSVFVASMINGKGWIKLDSQSKIMYLVGLVNGAAHCCLTV